MNLGITPINFKNNYSATQNCKNNQQQDFGALKFKVLELPSEERLLGVRKRDEAIDIFLGILEDTAKKIGLNTDKLTENGYSLDLIPQFENSSKMVALLKKGDKTLPVLTNFSRINALTAGEAFAKSVKKINIEV